MLSQTVSSLASFYETSYWILISTTGAILIFRGWRVFETRNERYLIFRLKGYALEKILKCGFATSLVLGLFSLPPMLLIGSTPSLLVSKTQTYLFLFLSTIISLSELLLCFTVSRSLIQRSSKKGLLSIIILLMLFIFAQFTGASLRIYEEPDQAISLENFPAKRGRWLILEGGASQHTNYNHSREHTKFGNSAVLLKHESFFKDRSTQNEDFYSFNQKIISPLNGIVSEVIDSLPDIPPFILSNDSSLSFLGNYMCIKYHHEQKTSYFVVSNMKRFSTKLRKGKRVSAGDELGRVGHSASVGWPQLRFHFQDAPLSDSTAQGIPIRVKSLNLHRWFSESYRRNIFLLRNDIINLNSSL